MIKRGVASTGKGWRRPWPIFKMASDLVWKVSAVTSTIDDKSSGLRPHLCKKNPPVAIRVVRKGPCLHAARPTQHMLTVRNVNDVRPLAWLGTQDATSYMASEEH